MAVGAAGDRRLARGRLRALVRRVHGAGCARVPAGALGGGIEFVGISNLRTFLENTSVWRRAAREREYGPLSDPELLERLSPWSRLDAIKAPLFIEHGRNDPRVPVSESEAIHAELVRRGVRCELVIYEDEGHMVEKLANRIDLFERAVFLDEVLGPVEFAPIR